MPSWLKGQRKQTLIDLSNEAGLEVDEESRRDEILDALDTYLQQNATRLSRNSTFEPYYGVRRTPFKARSSSTVPGVTSDDGEVKSVVRGRGRRATKVKQELEDDHPATASSPPAPPTNTALAQTSTTLPKRTPGRPRRATLPPSPADVANLAEYETTQLYAGLNDLYTVSGIPESIASVRDLCSSVTGIQTAFLLLETVALQHEVLGWRFAFEIPSAGLFFFRSDGPGISVFYPDLFQLLTSEFWLPTLLWSLTSLAVPALFAYFFNLTIREVRRHGARVSVARHTVDPLIFNIVKAITTWMVYGQGVGFGGWIDAFTAARVNHAMFGGYNGVLVGCYVCVVASLYEVAQGK